MKIGGTGGRFALLADEIFDEDARSQVGGVEIMRDGRGNAKDLPD